MAGAGGRAGGIVSFARSDWGRRRRSHVVIALLTALTVAVAIATFTAAERSLSTFDRLREETHASDLAITVTAGDPSETVERVRGTPGVVDARAISEVFVRPAGTDLLPGFTVSPMGPRLRDRSQVDTPLITDGRAPDPDRADEVALSATLADQLDLGPGDRLRLESMSDGWVEQAYGGSYPGPPDGPTIDVRVTGIARSPATFGARSVMIHVTPAFVDEYDGRIHRGDFVHAQIAPDRLGDLGPDDLQLGPGLFFDPSPFTDVGSTDNGLGTIATSLRLAGLAAAIAGALAVAIGLARASRASSADRAVLRALGWKRSDELRALALAFAPALATGVVVGSSLGVLAAPRAMLGLARSIDPDPGAIRIRAGIVLGVVAAAVVFVAVAIVAIVLITTRRAGRRPPPTRTARTPLTRPLEWWLGVRDALFGPAARGGRTSRAAVIAIAGALCVGIGALVVSSSIERLRSDRSLTGERPERLVDAGESEEAYERAVARLESDERVEVLAVHHIPFGQMRDVGEIEMLVVDPRRGQLDESVVEGRMPRSAGEVALGPRTAEDADVRVGDTVRLSGAAGAADHQVVGTVLFPEGDFEHDRGVALSLAAAEPLFGDVREGIWLRQIVYEWADGVDAVAADAALQEEGFVVVPNGVGFRRTPGVVSNLQQVADLPRQLLVLVGVLAAVTLLHAAWVTLALRARDLVTMRALGLTRRSIALMTWTQTIVIVVTGVVLGIPIGIILGRQVWRRIAEDAHLVVHAELGSSWVAALLGGAAVAGAVIAWLAGRWAARLDPKVALRAD